VKRARLHSSAFLGAALSSCVASAPTDDEVVRAYRLYGWHRCDAVLDQVKSIDFSGEDEKREPFFRLLQGYCTELEGDTAAAKELYSSVISNAPRTTQAFEAALRLRELERLERLGLTREKQKLQSEQARSSPLYRHVVQPIQRSEPKYPSAMVAAKVKGWVVVDFEIARNGSVVDPVVVDSDPPFVFDGAALAAMQHWVYESSNEDEPIRAVVRLNFDIVQHYQ